MKVKALFAQSCLTLELSRTIAHQAPLSMGFPRQEYWRGLPFPSPGDLPDPGIEPVFPALASGFFTTGPPGKPHYLFYYAIKLSLSISIVVTKIMASGPITSWQIDGETMETVRDFILGGSKITADGHCSHEIKRRLFLGRKAMTNLDSILKSRDITSLAKVHLVKAMAFPLVMWMWELDYKESWAPKNWCFWTVVLEKTLESPLDCKELQQVHPKGNQSWIFIGGTVAKAETPILWPPTVKNWLIEEDPDAGKDWRQEEKGTIEDEMVGWHHQLNGQEFE